MTPREVICVAMAIPFAPFYVKMADGSIHRFHHPELVAVGSRAVLAFAPNAVDFAVLDLRLMTEVGTIPSESGAERPS